MAVKIGIHGGQQDIEMDELRRMWRFADSNGFDFISLWDHFYEAPPIDGDSPVFEAIAGMAALAAETENARIGCHVLCVTYRNPGLLANSIMTIDHISHGRVEVGLGAGWQTCALPILGHVFRNTWPMDTRSIRPKLAQIVLRRGSKPSVCYSLRTSPIILETTIS